MKRLVFFVCLSLTLLGTLNSAIAADSTYPTPERFIQSLSPVPKIDQVVEGDLNGDGLSDRAVLAGGQEPRLYILLQMPDHAFRLAVSSMVGTLDVDGDVRSGAKVSIEKGSIYVWVNWATEQSAISFLSFHTARYQFMLYKGAWRMIGLTYHSGGKNPLSADRPGDPHDEKTDINLLTGNIISVATTTDESGVPRQESEYMKATGGRLCPLAEFTFALPNCLENWKTKEGSRVTTLLEVPGE